METSNRFFKQKFFLIIYMLSKMTFLATELAIVILYFNSSCNNNKMYKLTYANIVYNILRIFQVLYVIKKNYNSLSPNDSPGVKRYDSMLSLFDFGILIAFCVLLFSERQCELDNVSVYTYWSVYVLINAFFSFIVILLSLMCTISCFICCLPLRVIIAMNSQLGSFTTGATNEQLNALPSYIFNNGQIVTEATQEVKIISANDKECIVCTEIYTTGEQMSVYKCGHYLHKECSDEWLRVNATCPLCRESVIN